jgi:anti-sigma factor ChrR (cupin superfamily)
VLDAALIEALARTAQPTMPDPEATARMREQLFQRVHAPAPEFLFVHSHQGEWVRLKDGVDLKLLRHDANSRSFLLRLLPGARVPPHEHPLDEECVVLEGDATINGVLCRAGDYHLAPRGKPHDWLSSEGGCLLFIRGASERHVHN